VRYVILGHNRGRQFCSARASVIRCMRLLRLQLLKVAATAVICLGVFVSRLPAHEAQQEPSKIQTIRGQVLNRVTHEPVPRALVYSPDNRFATLTDGEGRFEFTVPDSQQTEPSQNIPDSLFARKPGFLDDRLRPHFAGHVTPGKKVALWLTPEALIVGRVLFPAGEISEPLIVQIYRRIIREGRAHWQSANVVRTNSRGEFRFAKLDAGSYKLFTHESLDRDPLTYDPRGQLYGYPPSFFPNAADLGSAGVIQLSAGQTVQADISPARRPYRRVKITVLNVPPGQGVEVQVSANDDTEPSYELGYSSNEHTIQGLLPDGNYVVEASSSGLNSATGILTLAVRGGPAEDARLALVPNGGVLVNVKEDFTLNDQASSRPFRTVPGSIGADGSKRHLGVSLESIEGFGRSFALRASTGNDKHDLSFEGVLPGRYWVRVDPFRGYVSSVRSGEIDLQEQPLVVGMGGSTSPVEITLRDDGAEIDGMIENLPASGPGPSGPNPPAAFVYCLPLADSKGHYREIFVSPDGTFNSQQIPPGAYRLLAFDRSQGEIEYRDSEAMRAFDGKGQVVNLVAGQKERVRLSLISSGEE